jgi:hypothetical protein
MVRRPTRRTPAKNRGPRPQAIRRRAARHFPRHQLLDAIVLLLIAIGLFYLASPARASDLAAEEPVAVPEGAVDHPPGGGETAAASASIEPVLETAAAEVAGPPSGAPVIGPPRAASVARPLSLYELAANRYQLNPRLLRALHLVESGGAADGCLANLEGSGATGPLQFKPATFRAYGMDADGDGRPNICGFADSLFSAARYLKALGADGEASSWATRRALERYGTDAELVLRMAA